jgi:hypothetical protein
MLVVSRAVSTHIPKYVFCMRLSHLVWAIGHSDLRLGVGKKRLRMRWMMGGTRGRLGHVDGTKCGK